jgi:hypothetical protein
MVATRVALDEILNVRWQVAQLRSLRRRSSWAISALSGVESDPNGVLVLALKQVEDHGFKIGGLGIGLTPDLTVLAEIVEHQLNVLTVQTHTGLQRYRIGI